MELLGDSVRRGIRYSIDSDFIVVLFHFCFIVVLLLFYCCFIVKFYFLLFVYCQVFICVILFVSFHLCHYICVILLLICSSAFVAPDIIMSSILLCRYIINEQHRKCSVVISAQ